MLLYNNSMFTNVFVVACSAMVGTAQRQTPRAFHLRLSLLAVHTCTIVTAFRVPTERGGVRSLTMPACIIDPRCDEAHVGGLMQNPTAPRSEQCSLPVCSGWLMLHSLKKSSLHSPSLAHARALCTLSTHDIDTEGRCYASVDASSSNGNGS